MEDHHGNLLLDDRPGGGASVRLVFPVAAPAAAKLASHGA
jgi:signal transduction histidine kinase